MTDDVGDAASILAEVVKEVPLYEIPDDLINQWQGLAQDQKFSPEWPRVAWDRLYRAIELLNDNTLRTIRVALEAVTASHTGDSKKLRASLQEITGS